MDPRTMTEDGYLTRQHLMTDVPFGKGVSARNGCGWIAAYNVLHALGVPCGWDTVRTGLNRFLPLGGRFGANVWVIIGYLEHMGCSVTNLFTGADLAQLGDYCDTGLLMYRGPHHNHFVMFRKTEDGRYRFLNASAAEPDAVLPPAEFYRKFVSFPLILGFGVRRKE